MKTLLYTNLERKTNEELLDIIKTLTIEEINIEETSRSELKKIFKDIRDANLSEKTNEELLKITKIFTAIDVRFNKRTNEELIEAIRIICDAM